MFRDAIEDMPTLYVLAWIGVQRFCNQIFDRLHFHGRKNQTISQMDTFYDQLNEHCDKHD